MAFLIFPSTRFTQLQAVNLLIRSLGESEIDTLSPPPTVDAETALSFLNEVDLEVQSRGWQWNREYDYPFALNGDLKVALPAACLEAIPSPLETAYTDIVQRGDFMYDRTRRVSTFPTGTTIHLNLIVRLEWDELPQVARSYIALEAAQRFQATKSGQQVVLQVNAQSLNRAWTTLEQREDAAANFSTTDSTAVTSALHGVGGMKRTRTGLR